MGPGPSSQPSTGNGAWVKGAVLGSALPGAGRWHQCGERIRVKRGGNERQSRWEEWEEPGSEPHGPSLDQLHVVGREHAEVAIGAVPAPPALIDHLDVGDDVLRIKGDLSVISWNETERGREEREVRNTR